MQITKTLGAEWIKRGVNVNAIGPCDFDTPMIAGALGDPEYADWISRRSPPGGSDSRRSSPEPCSTSPLPRPTWSPATC